MNISPSAIFQILNEYENILDFSPLFRLLTYPTPPHINSPSIILVTLEKSEEVLKINLVKDVKREQEILQDVNNRIRHISARKSVSILVPNPFGILSSTAFPDIAGSRMSFNGYLTIESRISGNTKKFKKIAKKILNEIFEIGVIWLSAAPKNILLGNQKNRDKVFTILDWQFSDSKVRVEDNFELIFLRAIQLREEWAHISPTILPFWSILWPTPNQLMISSSASGLLVEFDRKQIKSRRIKLILELCKLPDYLSDSALFRIIGIFLELHRETITWNNSVIYAADFLSESGGNYERVIATIMCWDFKNRHLINAANEVRETVIQAGSNIYFRAKNSVHEFQPFSEIDAKEIHETLFRDLQTIANREYKDQEWLNALVDRCRNYILLGNGQTSINWEMLVDM